MLNENWPGKTKGKPAIVDIRSHGPRLRSLVTPPILI